jgi:phosphoglycerate dehydrogenase-like enzyme
MKQGKWDKKSFLGEEVRGKVLGLAGLGRIGQEVARRAQAFEMTVIAHDPFIASNIAGRAPHRAGVARRSVRTRRLSVAAYAGDAANPAHLQC